jgi:hypothetical protein
MLDDLHVLLPNLAMTLIPSGMSVARNVIKTYCFPDMLNRLVLIQPRKRAGRIGSVKEVTHALCPQAGGYSFALGINDSEQLVGYSDTP